MNDGGGAMERMKIDNDNLVKYFNICTVLGGADIIWL